MADNNNNSEKPSNKPQEAISNINGYSVSQVKSDLDDWKFILLPLNNLLEWEHKFDPLIIVTIITVLFGFLMSWNPSILTTVSVIGIVGLVFDFLVPIINQNFFKAADWTAVSEARYTRICERISNLFTHIISLKQKMQAMRREKHTLYFLIVLFGLIFCIYIGQSVDNLLLTYLVVLTLSLIPGARRHNLFDKGLDFAKSFIKKQQKKVD